MLVSMGRTQQSTDQQGGFTHVLRASIALGIGDDDTISEVTSSIHANEADARGWVEAELPRAQFPEWVGRRQHGTAGAFLYGQIERGWYVDGPDAKPMFEPDVGASGWDADLVDGVLRWQPTR
jgi:hypothetical protein